MNLTITVDAPHLLDRVDLDEIAEDLTDEGVAGSVTFTQRQGVNGKVRLVATLVGVNVSDAAAAAALLDAVNSETGFFTRGANLIERSFETGFSDTGQGVTEGAAAAGAKVAETVTSLVDAAGAEVAKSPLTILLGALGLGVAIFGLALFAKSKVPG